MKAKRPSPAWVASALLLVAAWVGGAGCGEPKPKQAGQKAEEPYTVAINRADNGAAVEPGGANESVVAAVPRTLAFEMAGFARAPGTGEPQEEKSAASQAAIIDAFSKALIEARKARGQPVSDFTAELGPRLTVQHSRVNGGYQVEVSLLARGVKSTFVVRDGVLQHPPRDLKLIQRIFDETNGEFSLLGTEWQPANGRYVARVGCYQPAGVGEAIAGEAEVQPAGVPATP
jgi:hypothetical protein